MCVYLFTQVHVCSCWAGPVGPVELPQHASSPNWTCSGELTVQGLPFPQGVGSQEVVLTSQLLPSQPVTHEHTISFYVLWSPRAQIGLEAPCVCVCDRPSAMEVRTMQRTNSTCPIVHTGLYIHTLTHTLLAPLDLCWRQEPS